MSRFVDVRPGEGRTVVAAFATLFGVTSGHTLLETARDALFLARLPASRLPWVSIAIAILGVGIMRLGARRRSGPPRAPRRAGLPLALLVAAAVTALFWVAAGWRGAVFLYALYTWTGIFASFIVLQFWLLLGGHFTVGQARRLYGFVGSGSVLGAVAGAAAARGLAEVLVARDLLLGAAAVFAATGLFAAPALRSGVERPREAADAPAPRPTGLVADLRMLVAHPYLRRLALLALFATLSVTFVDYLFKSALASRVPKEELGAAFASVYVVLNGLALTVQLLVVGPFLQRLGVQRATWVMPLLLLGGAAGVVATGTLFAVLALRGVDGALRHSLHRTSVELLWVPVPDHERSRAKPVVDLTAQRGGQALASVAILGLVAAGAGERVLAVVVVVLTLGWAVSLLGLRRHYLEIFRRNLSEGRIEVSAELPPLDLEALEALIAALNSPKDAEVLAALDLLAAQSRQRLLPALILYHPSRRVVLRALELLAGEARTDFLPVAMRLLTHADAEVRAAALRAIDAVAPREDFLRGKLDDPHLEVRATAVVALLSHGWMPPLEAAQSLAQLVTHESSAVRIALARAIAQEPSPQFDDTLDVLVRCPEPEVQMEAAWAMGRRGADRFIAPLLGLLPFRLPASAAREALVQIGPPALEAIDRALSEPGTPRELRWALPRALGEFPAVDAVLRLLDHLERTDDTLTRDRILRTLVRLRAVQADVEIEAPRLVRVAERRIGRAFELVAQRLALLSGPTPDTPARQLLVAMLQDKERRSIERIFLILGLLYPSESFERIHEGLQASDARRRASSRELLESTLSIALRPGVLALVEEVPDRDRLARAPEPLRAVLPEVPSLLDRLQREGSGELAALAAAHARDAGLPVHESVPESALMADGVLAPAPTAAPA